MERWPTIKSYLPLLYLVVIAACIFIYITHYPPIPPENFILQDRLALEKFMNLVKYGYPLVGAVLIVYIITNPFSLLKHLRDLRRLKEGRHGQPPQDGSVVAVVGPIIADHRPVTTPVGGTNCIAYEYWVRDRTGPTNRDSFYFGYAFTPSSIDTSFGKIRILALPHSDFVYKPATTYDDSESQYKFKTYLRSNEFVEHYISDLPFYKERNMSMADRMNPVKRDVKMKLMRSNPDLDEYEFIERCLDEGEDVCAFGMYSASQQGLVHNSSAGDRFSIQIKRGPITKLIKKAISSIVGNLVGTACSLAMLTAMAWAYQNLYYVYTMFNLTNR